MSDRAGLKIWVFQIFRIVDILYSFCLLALSSFVLIPTALASSPNSGITYHGRVVRPDGTPLNAQSVSFKMQIRSPGAEDFLLYEETQTLNLLNSNGIFAITINDGSGTRSDSSGYSFSRIFANRGSLTLADCAAGTTYTPNTADGRKFVVMFRSEMMANWETMPAQHINYAPFAIESRQISGFGAQNLLRVDDAAAVANATPYTLQQLTDLNALVGGTSTKYMKVDATGGAALPVFTAAPASLSPGSMRAEYERQGEKFNF